MATRTTTRSKVCKFGLHGYGVYWLNGCRFTEAVYTSPQAKEFATEALRWFGEGYEVARCHVEHGQVFECTIV